MRDIDGCEVARGGRSGWVSIGETAGTVDIKLVDSKPISGADLARATPHPPVLAPFPHAHRLFALQHP